MHETGQTRNLAGFTGGGYDRGRGIISQILWLAISGSIFIRWWCPARLRVAILRGFGADIGSNVLIRHRVRIHWPWKLSVGSNSWVGEGSWFLNLEPIDLGTNVVISQEVLLCTGSHDRNSPTFEFDNGPISVGDGSWVAARATVLRGVRIGENVTVGATALVTKDVPDRSIVLAPAGRIIVDQIKTN